MILNKTKDFGWGSENPKTYYMVSQRFGSTWHKAAMISEFSDEVPRTLIAAELIHMRRKVRAIIGRAQRNLEKSRKR